MSQVRLRMLFFVPRSTGPRNTTLPHKAAAAVLAMAATSIVTVPALTAQSVAKTTDGSVPQLHHRSAAEPDGAARGYRNPQAPTNLPTEASGEYQLGKPGDVIEIILDNNGLTGYISMLGRAEHDRSAPLTYFFDQTELNARSLAFTTKQVHGQWYTFSGTVERGSAATREKEGYYLLKGTLTLHSGGAPEQPRNVSLPLARSENG